MIIVTHTGQTRAGRAFGSVKGLRVRARKSRCTLKIKSERTNKQHLLHKRTALQTDFLLFLTEKNKKTEKLLGKTVDAKVSPAAAGPWARLRLCEYTRDYTARRRDCGPYVQRYALYFRPVFY